MLNFRILPATFFSIATLLLLQACSPAKDADDQSFRYRSELKPFTSCEQLTDYLLTTLQQEQKLKDYYYALPAVMNDREVDFAADVQNGTPAAAQADSAATESAGSIDNYSATNNQVSGVDEGDFIKTNGDYTYILSGGFLVIIDSWPAAQSHEVSRIKLAGFPAALFVKDDLVWVVSQLYQKDWEVRPLSIDVRSNQLTRVSLIDISDIEAPEVIRESNFEGRYIDARRIDNHVFMITTAHLDLYPFIDLTGNLDMQKLLPMFSDKKMIEGVADESSQLISECGSIYRPETANGTGTVSLISFDLADPQGDLSRQTIISNSGLIYANQNHLYIATMEDNFWRWLPVLESDAEQPIPGTTLHKFVLGEKPQYLASGRVDGYLINQFAMDEKDDLLRVVTTTDAWWSDEPPQNSLFILQQKDFALTLRSRLDNLGKPGERIYAARFLADQGFLVTFEQIDPLYTLDLSDPDNPRIAGELEVPGFSTYLHPLEAGLLLAIGRSVDSNSITLSLFDTSDFDNPQLLHKQEIGKGSYSTAEYNHKAFTWYPDEQMLALPVSRWNSLFVDGVKQYDVFNGLQLYRVDRQTGFELSGEIDHSSFYHDDNNQRWFYPASISRSFFVSDTQQNSFVYSISPRGMKVNALDDVENDLAAVPLPAYDWDNFILYD
jgi:uncharacterized secreted protein with C-terminal beta-propeller domain